MCILLYYTAFVLEWQGWVVATETGLQSLKDLLPGPLLKKFAYPCFKEWENTVCLETEIIFGPVEPLSPPKFQNEAFKV